MQGAIALRVRFSNCGAVDLSGWKRAGMLFPYTEVLSAAPQVGFVVGFRALCLEVDNIRRYFGWKPGL